MNGWSVINDPGSYGTNYLLRAMVALIRVGANAAGERILVDYAVQHPTAFLQ